MKKKLIYKKNKITGVISVIGVIKNLIKLIFKYIEYFLLITLHYTHYTLRKIQKIISGVMSVLKLNLRCNVHHSVKQLYTTKITPITLITPKKVVVPVRKNKSDNVDLENGYQIIIEGDSDLSEQYYIKALKHLKNYINIIYPVRFKKYDTIQKTSWFEFLSYDESYLCYRNKSKFYCKILINKQL